jgi:hypothetical protein
VEHGSFQVSRPFSVCSVIFHRQVCPACCYFVASTVPFLYPCRSSAESSEEIPCSVPGVRETRKCHKIETVLVVDPHTRSNSAVTHSLWTSPDVDSMFTSPRGQAAKRPPGAKSRGRIVSNCPPNNGRPIPTSWPGLRNLVSSQAALRE